MSHKKPPDLAEEHRRIVSHLARTLEQLRRENEGDSSDVVVIVDCAAPNNRIIAEAMGMQMPPGLDTNENYVFAVGLAPLDKTRDVFKSRTFPQIAQGLQTPLVPLAYRVIVLTDGGATIRQCVYTRGTGSTPN